MSTKASICNMALAHIGAKALISDLDTDQTTEAKICRIYFYESLRFVLSVFDWGFARKNDNLALLDETVPDDWGYMYAYPNDCIKARQIFDSTRRLGITKIPFEIGLNSAGNTKVILTDQQNAQLLYTKDVTSPTLFSSAFSILMSYHLASLVAYPITKKNDLTERMFNLYKLQKIIAMTSDAEEGEYDEMPDSEFLRAR